jgi:molybdenum cofactor cytidylyltransferase
MPHIIDIDQKKSIALVILAAGKSSRMGAVKQNLPWKDSTLLVNSIETGLKSNADSVFVVLGANSEIIHPFIDHLDINIIENQAWAQGLSSSISTAVNYIERAKNQFDSILFCLADMPFVKRTHLNKMIDTYKSNIGLMIATKFKNKVMVPALFDSIYFDALRNLTGTIGAKELLKKHDDTLRYIEVGNEIELTDLDTQNAYNHYKKK